MIPVCCSGRNHADLEILLDCGSTLCKAAIRRYQLGQNTFCPQHQSMEMHIRCLKGKKTGMIKRWCIQLVHCLFAICNEPGEVFGLPE